MTYLISYFVEASYFIAALLFIVGLKQMSSPVTARRGILWAGAGMLLATLVTFADPRILGSERAALNLSLIAAAIIIGGGYAWYSGRKVAMADMPQMIAMYNGMGGGAAAAIAAVELLKAGSEIDHSPGAVTPADVLGPDVTVLAILGAVIGTVAFSGSIVAWAKLDGRLDRSRLVPAQHLVNGVLALLTVGLAVSLYFNAGLLPLLLFYMLALVLGVFITVPVGGADMPVIISLFNALTGLAVGFEGYVLGNAAMIIAGIVVGSAGSLLTRLMAVAMNRSVLNVFFAGVGTGDGTDSGGAASTRDGIDGTKEEMKEIKAQDAGILMAFAGQVVVIPGYGMAVAQAQHKIWELSQLLQQRGVAVKFAIHPVAGRMPGHMNVLLAEAGVPYDMIYDMEDINADFKKTTVALVIGANDVVNPSAKRDQTSPLYGMPILDAMDAENVVVIKRGRGTGFSGVENPLFFADNTRMLFGDGQKAAAELIHAVKELG